MDREVIDIQVLAYYTQDKLEEAAKKLVRSGWQPLGPAQMVADYVPSTWADTGEPREIDAASDYTWHITMVQYGSPN